MKRYFAILFLFFISFGCTQKPARIVYKNTGVYKPTYSETYVESPDGKLARSLRGNNDSSKAQEIDIINKDNVPSNDNRNFYMVQYGDSLWSISRKYDMKVQELVDLNNLRKPYNIKPGQMIRISNGGNIVKKNNNNDDDNKAVIKSQISTKLDTYKVKSGDNLIGIAKKYDMTTSELAELNNLKKPYKIRIGQNLKIKKTYNNIDKNVSTYTVKSGDNLTNIARKHDMTLSEIIELNDLDKPYVVKIGQKIKINTDEPKVVIKNTTQQSNNKNINITKSEQKQVVKKAPKVNSFIWPIKGNVISSFGSKSNGLYNDGINISAPKGTDFRTCEDGVVAYVGNELRGYGTIILIKHENNWISAYAHCDTAKVSRGDKVQKGQIIGTVGNSGNVSTPQLYFSLRNGREAVDPIKYLKNE